MDIVATQNVGIARLGFTAAQVAIAWPLDQHNRHSRGAAGGKPAAESRCAGDRFDDEDRAAIAALPKDRRYVTPAFAPDWNTLTL
jgi:2,5-diketo-D-gluconate reductase B